MKLCLSGGHITPALALAQYALKKGDQVSLIGRRYTDAARTKLSLEATLSEQYGLEYHPLDPPKTPRSLASFLLFPHQLAKVLPRPANFYAASSPMSW
jgi:UDP-N-acetylglucosamine:LPS N-acetylglucosamine transferase